MILTYFLLPSPTGQNETDPNGSGSETLYVTIVKMSKKKIVQMRIINYLICRMSGLSYYIPNFHLSQTIVAVIP